MTRSFTYWLLRLLLVAALCVVLSSCNRDKTIVLKTEVVRVDSLEQIIPLTGPLVKPVLYTHVSGLDKLPGRKARANFFAVVLPSILVAKYRIEESRKTLTILKSKAAWNEKDSAFYNDLRNRYKAKNIDDVIARTGTLPNSIVMAQAAIESGWGQSRFFLEGNNLFGMWSYNRFEPRIAAGKTRGKKRIYLRAYMDISQSISHYFDILSRSWAYRSLRKTRRETSDPHLLLPHLKNFSERREAYTHQLKRVIKRYDLTKYDQYQIDPAYIVEE